MADLVRGNVPSFSVARRGLRALLLAFALTIMHGGFGQAVACAGMSAIASPTMTVMPGMGSGTTPISDPLAAGDHAQHHQPFDHPMSIHVAAMCVSPPATASSGGAKGGGAVTALVSQRFQLNYPYRPTISLATGRELPAPDLASELCVIRV